jgi:hypothetical protein
MKCSRYWLFPIGMEGTCVKEFLNGQRYNNLFFHVPRRLWFSFYNLNYFFRTSIKIT